MLNKERSFEDLKYRLERIVLKNLFYFIAVAFIVFYNMSSSMDNIANEQELLRKEMEKNRNSYIALDDQGIPIELPRTYVGATNNEAIVTEALVKLIVSRANISNNFKISKFDDVSQIAEQSQGLSTFANEYIILHEELLTNLNIDEKEMKKIKEENNKGLKHFTAYLVYIKNLFATNKLPHKLTINKYNVVEYKPNGSEFDITMKVEEIIDSYAGNDQNGDPIWKEKKGTTTIKARGFFNIKLRTRKDEKLGLKGINTKGLRFTELSIQYAI